MYVRHRSATAPLLGLVVLFLTGGAALAWQAGCKTDTMDDTLSCHIIDLDARILVYYGAAEQPIRVCIVGHDFPDRRGAIRIDKNKMFPAPDGCSRDPKVFAQMKAGHVIRVQYYEWPYDYPKDGQAFLTGFSAALAELRKLRGGLR